MIGFPLQLPIEATKPRAIEITDWFGDLGHAKSYRGVALVIEVTSQAEATALTAWLASIPVAVPMPQPTEVTEMDSAEFLRLYSGLERPRDADAGTNGAAA